MEAGEQTGTLPLGYILSLEGADSIVHVDYLQQAYADGLRALGPAHYGPGRYANGTDSTGHLNEAGKALLKEMEKLGIILDATHLCDDAFWDAMELFNGPVWASHNNCRALVNHNRQFSDEMIRTLIAKGAVIGGALDAWMMVPGWVRGVSMPEAMHCKLEIVIDHLDHICQIAGNARHVGMGTDLDGGYGREQCPYDLDTIADLQRMTGLLAARLNCRTEILSVPRSDTASIRSPGKKIVECTCAFSCLSLTGPVPWSWIVCVAGASEPSGLIGSAE